MRQKEKEQYRIAKQHARITRKPYFWFLLLSPLIIAIISSVPVFQTSALILETDFSDLSIFYNSTIVQDIVDEFQFPLSAFGVALITTGAAMAFHRLSISHTQLDQQLFIMKKSNYQQVRSEFLDIYKEKEYGTDLLGLPPSILFASLFPRSENYDLELNEGIRNICDPSNENGLLNLIKKLDHIVVSDKSDLYYTRSWAEPINHLVTQLKNALPIKHEIHIKYSKTDIFTENFPIKLIYIINDTLNLIEISDFMVSYELVDENTLMHIRKSVAIYKRIEGAISTCQGYIRNMNTYFCSPNSIFNSIEQEISELVSDLNRIEDFIPTTLGLRLAALEQLEKAECGYPEEELNKIASKLGVPYQPTTATPPA